MTSQPVLSYSHFMCLEWHLSSIPLNGVKNMTVLTKIKHWISNQIRVHNLMVDRETVWDHLLDTAPDITTAQDLFMLHMDLNPKVYGNMSKDEKLAYVETLPWREKRPKKLPVNEHLANQQH